MTNQLLGNDYPGVGLAAGRQARGEILLNKVYGSRKR